MLGQFYRKEYLPGYTGHVPYKNNIFGMTAGDINKQLIRPNGAEEFIEGKKVRAAGRKQFEFQRASMERVRFGNNSRMARNWIGGPTHEFYNQRIPGYKGHVPGIVSENLFAKSFAKCTKTALHNEMERGHDHPARKRFLSQNQTEFCTGNFRRYVETPMLQNKRDYEEYAHFVNEEQASTVKDKFATVTAGFSDGMSRSRSKTAFSQTSRVRQSSLVVAPAGRSAVLKRGQLE